MSTTKRPAPRKKTTTKKTTKSKSPAADYVKQESEALAEKLSPSEEVVDAPTPEPKEASPTPNLPAAYQDPKPHDESSDSGINLTEMFIDALPSPEDIREMTHSGQVRDHRDHVDEPFDADGNPLLDFRWGALSVPGRPEMNRAKGFVPCWVDENKNVVPPGTKGAREVVQAGATLLVRRQDVAEMKRKGQEDMTKALLRRDQQSSAEELTNSGVVDVVKNTSVRQEIPLSSD